MRLRKLHRAIGLVMVLPLFCWAATGLVFFLKPGYGAAYELLQLKTYPLEQPVVIRPEASWQEFRVLKTILGTHLLVRSERGWQQRDPANFLPRGLPDDKSIQRLVADALAANPGRYGKIITVAGSTVTTSTGVDITLDWNQLSLQQQGRDTAWLDRLYRIHYLQWTGHPSLDRPLGLAGLASLVALAVAGAVLAFRRR
jgi:uncharacterized iron-regulated membrane protein